VAQLIVGAGGLVLLAWMIVGLLLRRARRRPSLDKYAGIPPVTKIPSRPDRRAFEER
jgi:hypothetical protein